VDVLCCELLYLKLKKKSCSVNKYCFNKSESTVDPVHAVKAYGEVVLLVHLFLTSALQ